MKNPFKGLQGKIKATLDRLKMSEDKKAELQKNMVDNFGDGCFIGGLTLIGAAVFTPVAVGPTLAAATLFIAAGASAKYTAGKMKPNGPTLEKAIPPAPDDQTQGLVKAKPLGPEFKLAKETPAAKAKKNPFSRFLPPPPGTGKGA